MKTFFSLLLILFCHFSWAQDDVKIEFTENKEVLLNETAVDKTTTLKEITEILGEATLIKDFPTGKAFYQYPETGLALQFVDNQLLFIGANYNWDGDENFPETTYEGTLSIDGITFKADSKEEVLTDIEAVEIKCVIPGMCVTDPKKEKTNIIIGFKDGKVTQVGFEFH
ncbi:DUF7738 domain-containing protein [Fulvivirga ligni]|uniref:DUF7738 domain-containing protein n=1 Tax=Fulvivirga ligni TaxID=2904246 RepID=UPI001F32C5DB|nr:hypothetical protein [Fulvivirga ligni]UII20708.1 hypothetical protein LVD16_22975 [Fulvivirga ligni]